MGPRPLRKSRAPSPSLFAFALGRRPLTFRFCLRAPPPSRYAPLLPNLYFSSSASPLGLPARPPPRLQAAAFRYNSRFSPILVKK